MKNYIKINRKKEAQDLILANVKRLPPFAQNRIKEISKSLSLNNGAPGSSAKPEESYINQCDSSSSGQLVLSDSNIQFRTLLSLSKGSEIKLLNSNNNQVKGEKSFNGNTLGDGVISEVVYALSIAYKSDVADDKVANIIYDEDFDAFLRNSSIVIRQDNREILRQSMMLFDPRTIDLKDRFVELDFPMIIIGGTELPFDYILETPENTDVPTGFHYLEIITKGTRATKD